MSAHVQPHRPFAAAAILIAGLGLLAGIFWLGMSDKSAASRDFIEYWSLGQQLHRGANPYDAADTYRLERAAGLEDSEPKISYSPPISLFLTLPLGYMSARAGVVLWSLALLISLALAIWIFWILQGRPQSRYHLFGFLFAPVVACHMAGQLGTFLLLAVMLFFYLNRSHPFWAGAVLLPCAWKPHLFLPMAVVLLLWSIWRRSFFTLAGFASALAASCLLSLAVDRHAWSQYSSMMSHTGLSDGFVPTLSAVFRLLVDRNLVGLQYLPEVCACVWGAFYFWSRRGRWNWLEHGLILLAVSAACAPYAWFSDEAVLLPVVLAGLYRALAIGRSWVPLALIAGVALAETMASVRMDSLHYIWTVPAWLGWYLYATWSRKSQLEAVTA